jgi:hypothetical protein
VRRALGDHRGAAEALLALERRRPKRERSGPDLLQALRMVREISVRAGVGGDG